MKALISALVLIVATTFIPVVQAQSYLCIADHITGFNWRVTNGRGKIWETQTFENNRESKYIVRPTAEQGSAYRVDKFSDDSDTPLTLCAEPFDNQGWLTCSETGRFRLNNKSRRFIWSYDIGYAEPYDSHIWPYMQIGTCSKISD